MSSRRYVVGPTETLVQAKTDPILDQLKLSTYEYVALEERYRTLLSQHYKLRKLTSAYNEVIQGSLAGEDPDMSIEQIRAEAGHEGLRAKALELDALRPIVRAAGGVQALTFLTQSAQELIEKAGSLQNLKQIVKDTTMFRHRFDELGGLRGLDQLVSHSNALQARQRELAELRSTVDGVDGLRAKASKYDMLQQAFAAIDGGAENKPTQPSAPTTTAKTKHRTTPPSSVHDATPPCDVSVMMNPERARLLSLVPDRDDPHKHLYAPKLKPPARNLSTKADNANNIPLGRPRPSSSVDRDVSDTQRKRKHHGDILPSVSKRPRVDIGRASALVQATLAASSVGLPSSYDGRPLPTEIRSPLNYGEAPHEPRQSKEEHDQSRKQRIESVQAEVDKLIESRGELKDATSPTLTRCDRLSVESLLGPSDGLRQPIVKIEEATDNRHAACSTRTLIASSSKQGHTQVLVGGYPIAFWTGTSNTGDFYPSALIKDDRIPSDLAYFLYTKMKRFFNNANAKTWNAMLPNPDTCVLRYLVDGHRPSGLPQERRACRTCSSVWVGHHRPCALLLEIDGVRTIVFMPLRDDLRQGVAWPEKRFWLMGA